MNFSFLYICYRLLSQSLAIPIAHILLYCRLRKGKEIQERLKERRGLPSKHFPKTNTISHKIPPKNLIWIHAASVGESVSILSFIDHLLTQDPFCTIMVTTSTVTSAHLMDQKLPPRAFHQFIPLDLQSWVKRFLDFWQPKIIFWVESELWPNFIYGIGARKIPLVMINGRMSQTSFHRWQWARTMIATMLQQFSLCVVQSTADVMRLQLLGASKVIQIENLKFAAKPLSYDVQTFKELQQTFQHRLIWVAASTHEAEEEIIIAGHHLLKRKFSNLLTIVAPRHPNRGATIKQKWQPTLNIVQRSLRESVSTDTDIYLVDTLGELGLFYALTPVVFVGGSLAPIGGHNLIEPAHFRCALLHGSHMFKCQDVRDLFHQFQAAFEINSAQELANQIDYFLSSADQCSEAANRALKVVQAHQDVLPKLMTKLDSLFKSRMT